MQEFSPQDFQYMRRALQLAERGLYSTDPNPNVGCVLVNQGQIIGEGWHQYAGGPHAEIVALKSCASSTVGATAYVTLEPCAYKGRTGPCCEALIEAGVTKVMVAMLDPNPRVNGRGIAAMETAGLECKSGLLENEARQLNLGFIQRMTKGRPLVCLKVAASLDGATALHNGLSQWITNDIARRDVHQMRARSSVVLTGVGTVLADDPRMNARFESQYEVQQPLRVLLDSNARAPTTAKIFNRQALVFVGKQVDAQHARIEYHRVDTDPSGGLNLEQILDELAKREFNEIMVEAGPTLCGSFLRQRLVDEIVVYQAPIIMGSGTRGMFDIGPLDSMDQVVRFHLIESLPMGDCMKHRFKMSD